jgi:FkbH-like protein
MIGGALGRLRRFLSWRRAASRIALDELRERHNGAHFLHPTDLAVTEALPRRLLVVGSCLAEKWLGHMECGADFVMTNNLNVLPDEPPRRPQEYDLQVIQIPLRMIHPEATLWAAGPSDQVACRRAFQQSVRRLECYLEMAAKWNRLYGLPTLVANFLVPQQNAMGLLMPPDDLRNPAYFVSQLNLQLARLARSYRDMHLLDIDGIAASLGRQYIQDDAVTIDSHGAVLAPHEQDVFEPMASLRRHYELKDQLFYRSVWLRIRAMFRVMNRVDPVKLVIVDLDDTLWRGTAAEGMGRDMADAVEGWPLGVMEALCYLKKRGIVLAIASRNEEARLRTLWPGLTGGRLSLDDFASLRINWRPKLQNVQEILEEVNVLPRNVVFVDDNPAERAAVRAAFPEIRTLGAHPYYLRRILLWSPETQVATISKESANRTELIRARIERESLRARMTREEFLKELGVQVEIAEVDSADHPAYGRLLELVNKTNQFNTTGRRWSDQECRALLEQGGRLLAVKARDRYSDYGSIACAIVKGCVIEQFVMSCRVIGLDIEQQVLSYIERKVRAQGGRRLLGALRETEFNQPCRDLYRKCGYAAGDEGWVKLLQGTQVKAPAERRRRVAV